MTDTYMITDDDGESIGVLDRKAEVVVASEPDCCGKSLWPADGPLVLACQLCPNSPTYWRGPEHATPVAEHAQCPHGRECRTDPESAIGSHRVTRCTCCGAGFNGRVAQSTYCKICRPHHQTQEDAA